MGLEPLAGPLYFVCVVLVVLPALDFVTNVWPPRPGDLGWRYGMVGLLSGFLLTPLLAAAMAAGTAGLLGHRRLLRVVGISSLVGGVLILAATGLFTLDAIQLGADVPPENEAAYRVGAIRAWIKNLVVAGCLGWIWLGAMRSARATESA